MTPLLLGHRGSPNQFHENTLPSFQAALDAGLDGVEMDVRRLADGTLVVHHDPHLPGGRRLPELRRADLPAQVPTLEQFLDWMEGNGAFVNVEIKAEEGRPDDRVARTLGALRERGFGSRVILSSFSPLVLDAARQYAPEIERGFLFARSFRCGDVDLIPRVMERVGAVAIHPHFSLVDEHLMAQARAHSWRVNAWTVNEAAEVERLTRLGVSGLIGNHPHILKLAQS